MGVFAPTFLMSASPVWAAAGAASPATSARPASACVMVFMSSSESGGDHAAEAVEPGTQIGLRAKEIRRCRRRAVPFIVETYHRGWHAAIPQRFIILLGLRHRR